MAKKADNSVIIVGGGHNGLVCACYLAEAGLDVTVLEQRDIMGGAAITEEFSPGFKNSVASYTVSLLHHKVSEDLHLFDHGLRILERPVNNFLPLPDGNSLTRFNDADKFKREVARFSGADSEHLDAFEHSLANAVALIRDLLLTTPPALHASGLGDIWQMLSLSRRFAGMPVNDKAQLLRLFSVSAGEMLDDEFESDPLKALIGFDAIVGNFASPYQSGSAYVLLHHLLGEVNGKAGQWGHAVGGMGAITSAMSAEALARGVKLETGAKVDQVLVEHGKATGVRLSNGDELSAAIIVANVNPKLLHLHLLDPYCVPNDTLRRFEQYKCKSGSFRMNVALSELPAFTADTPENALSGGIILSPSLTHMDQAYRDAVDFGYSRSPVIELLIPSLLDDTLAPKGQHVASLFCQQFDPSLGNRWLLEKDKAADLIVETVNQYAPNFKASIISRQVLSPYDLETKFGLLGGDIFHGRLSLEQLFSARPLLGMGQYKTDITGLFMCGAGTHPGGGVSGIPGHNAAREILKKR